jgi:hypothetical protein
MLSQFRCALSLIAGAAVLATATQAPAQWMNSNACGCAAPPMVRTPVVQKCFQQVAVTEYQQVKHKVRRPVTEVEYIDQPVTTYRPVVETRSRDVPVTTYQNVQECRTVTKNASYWKTNYYKNPKMTACQYDPRRSVAGWWNRGLYRIRSSFTPSVTATRQYVPQTIAQQVPVNRRVPITTVQKQTYQVTKYVPETTTRRVAVNKVRWVEQEVIAMKPVTVMKTVPSTRTAWTWAPYGSASAISYAQPATAISLKPTADPVGETKRARVSTRTKEEDAADDRGDINRVDTSALEPIPEPRRIRERITPRPNSTQKRSLFVAVPARRAGATRVARVGGWKASSRTNSIAAPLLLPQNVKVASAND